MNTAIEATNLVKHFGNVRALDHVELEVSQGEIFGFLGPNGAGKSTFVKILLNLVSASEGYVRVFGSDSRKYATRKHVGFLPENIRPYLFLTVEEFVQFHAELAEVSAVSRKKEVMRCLELTGMAEHCKKKMGTLSKGMTQRVGISQAILGEPKLLILDEPTSGLDPIGIKELRNLLVEMKNRGTTIFLNSHLLSEIERTCDRIAILNKGKIIKSGTKSDLSEKEAYLEVIGEGFTDAMCREINAVSKKQSELNGDCLKVYPKEEGDSVIVHKTIVEHGGKLISLSWRGESLEELFYRLVKQ